MGRDMADGAVLSKCPTLCIIVPMPTPTPTTTQTTTTTTSQTQASAADQVESPARAQANPQQQYNQSLAKPAVKCRAAFRAAGLPLSKFIPDDVTSFEQKPDGSFTLKLPKEVRIKIGATTLVLTTSIGGKLGAGEMTNVSGIYGEKKVAFITGKGNILDIKRQGDELVVHTDNSMAQEMRLKLADLGGPES